MEPTTDAESEYKEYESAEEEEDKEGQESLLSVPDNGFKDVLTTSDSEEDDSRTEVVTATVYIRRNSQV